MTRDEVEPLAEGPRRPGNQAPRGRVTRGQDPILRARIERRSIDVAIAHYRALGATEIQEVKKPYDLQLEGTELHVEVKGSSHRIDTVRTAPALPEARFGGSAGRRELVSCSELKIFGGQTSGSCPWRTTVSRQGTPLQAEAATDPDTCLPGIDAVHDMVDDLESSEPCRAWQRSEASTAVERARGPAG